MKKNAAVYLCNFTPARQREILPLCAQCGIRVRKVDPADFGQQIGLIAGLPEFERSQTVEEAEPFTEELMLMQGFDQALLDDFLNRFRQRRVKSVALKAVITPTNSGWTLLHLHDEIAREHEYMMQQRRQSADRQ